jgi:ribosome biogenesis GTPase / thiamine phosphate phosphatase
MAAAKKKKRSGKGGRKVRVDFRRNRQTRARQQNLTHEMLDNEILAEDATNVERVTTRSEVSKRRTVVGVEADGEQLVRVIDSEGCQSGRVLSFIGLNCVVRSEAGDEYECTIRGVLRTMARESRNAVVTGDHVLFRQQGDDYQGVIERVEPRHGVMSRGSQGKEHIIAANVDQVLIMVSAAEPELKPQLVDRFLISAERLEIRPIICINKIDLASTSELLPAVRTWGRIGYQVVLTSTVDGRGIEQVRQFLTGRDTAVSGQSGVGKSSLLNVVDPSLHLKTANVSDWSSKGTHTTRRARLVPLSFGGSVVDTPGVRQFEIWDVGLEEVDGFFREFRPYIAWCRFPDCSHQHEKQCGVKCAVACGQIAEARYQSYLRLRIQDVFHWTDPER